MGGKHEVWSRVALAGVELARRSGYPVAPLFDGLPFDEAGLRRRLRIDWDDYCTMVERGEALMGGPAALRRHTEALYHLSFPEVGVLAGLLISPLQLYRFVIEVVDSLMFPPVIFRVEVLGDARLRVNARMRPGARPCRALMHASQGAFEGMTRHLGLPPAHVVADITPESTSYLVTLPPSRTLPARIGRATRAIFEFTLGPTADGAPLTVALGSPPDEAAGDPVERAARRWGLTPRKAQILAEIARGETNKTIAHKLGCSENTVEVHVSQLLRKAGVASRAQLISRVFSES